MDNYANFVNSLVAFKRGLEAGVDSKTTFKDPHYDFAFQIKRSAQLINEAIVFEIDDDLKLACALHKAPKLKHDILPHSIMFIDVDFDVSQFDILKKKGINKMKGILLCRSPLYDENNRDIKVGEAINAITICQRDDMVYLDSMTFNQKITDPKFQNAKITRTRLPENAFIENFIYNVLNFINDPDAQLIKIVRSEKNIKRRLRQGRPMMPSSIQVRLTGLMKVYISDFKKMIKSGSAQWHYNYRFPVRSHVRKYRDVNGNIVKETKVKEYVKGSGPLVPKKYKLEVGPVEV